MGSKKVLRKYLCAKVGLSWKKVLKRLSDIPKVISILGLNILNTKLDICVHVISEP